MPVPPVLDLGYELSNVAGYLPRTNEISYEGQGREVYINPQSIAPAVMYFDTVQTVQGIAMRSANDVYITSDVTPNPFESLSAKPNYDRRYTVLPVPAIGLTGVTIFDELQ